MILFFKNQQTPNKMKKTQEVLYYLNNCSVSYQLIFIISGDYHLFLVW